MIKTRLQIILFILFAISFLIVEYSRVGDFNIFLQAAEALGNNENIYTRFYGDGFRYFYSPLFAVIIYPLTLISSYLASLIWNSIGFLLLARIFWILSKLFLSHLKIKPDKIQILTFSAVFFLIFSNFHVTQMSVFILFAIMESIYQVYNKKRLYLGAAILALAINIKILPIVIIPYFLYRREFFTSILVLIFLGIYIIIPTFFLGVERSIELHMSWLGAINPAESSNIIDISEPGLHSITTLLSTLLTDKTGVHELGLKRNIFNLEESTVGLIINTIRFGLILFTLYFLRTKPFKKQNDPLHKLWEISYICLIIPLIFPHQQIYAFLLILPAAYYVILFLLNVKFVYQKAWKAKMMIGIGIITFLIINLELFLGLYKHIFCHYKTLTYGVILLLILLAVSTPEKLNAALNKSKKH